MRYITVIHSLCSKYRLKLNFNPRNISSYSNTCSDGKILRKKWIDDGRLRLFRFSAASKRSSGFSIQICNAQFFQHNNLINLSQNAISRPYHTKQQYSGYKETLGKAQQYSGYKETFGKALFQPKTSNKYVMLGALFAGFSLFTYGAHQYHFVCKDSTILKMLMPPVHAVMDFQRNNFIADVVEKAGPAVVFLEIKGRHPITGRPVTLSNGSGFIVRSNGIILTNAHVVAMKSSVSVKLQDGRVFEGQVTAVDPISDLAAVKIPTSGLPTIPLGKSNEIRPGEWVLAMGSPLSLSNTVTCGIVSSVQRASKELGLRNKNMDYIQTDAVINFGNSGGPLVNLDGKAIGINTMKVTTGISFAIPSDYAIKFLTKAEALMKTGQTENGFLKRRYMGITMLTLTEGVMRDLRNNIKMPNFADVKGGVFVYKVIPGSPAHIGGILAGDIIIEISGVAIRSAADVYDAVEKGDHLKVTVIRGSEKKIISINTQETI